jgi:CMP-N-acetylneuraminic acid synthetase
MSILAVIPARGGSKGIKNKNLISLSGKKLIQYTIEEAKKSSKINKIFVSSDSKKILDFSKKFRVSTIQRPKKFSRSKARFSPS